MNAERSLRVGGAFVVLVLLALLSSQAALAATDPAEAEQLAMAKERWRTQHARDYSFTVEALCFCGGPRGATITVVDRTPRHTPRRFRDIDTAGKLFALARRTIAGDRSHQVRYRPRRGLPSRIGVTYVIGKPRITRRYRSTGMDTHGCPHRSQPPAPASPFTEAAAVLVPPAPRSVVLCRYRGLDSDPDRSLWLARARRLGPGPTLSTIAARLNALKPWPFIGGLPTSCPADDASQVIAHFGYPNDVASAVTVDLEGCNTVTNGRIFRTAYPSDPVLGQLERLTGFRRAPPGSR